jgi:hypothetical protein
MGPWEFVDVTGWAGTAFSIDAPVASALQRLLLTFDPFHRNSDIGRTADWLLSQLKVAAMAVCPFLRLKKNHTELSREFKSIEFVRIHQRITTNGHIFQDLSCQY